jgi:hypothetical protein
LKVGGGGWFKYFLSPVLKGLGWIPTLVLGMKRQCNKMFFELSTLNLDDTWVRSLALANFKKRIAVFLSPFCIYRC